MPDKVVIVSRSIAAVSVLQIGMVVFVPTGPSSIVTVTVKGSPTQPAAEVGVTVYTTTSGVVLLLVKVSVIVLVVEGVSVSPVTLGLSVATQEKVFPVPLVIASKSIFVVCVL